MTLETLIRVGVLPMLCVAIVLAFVRLLRGPQLPDRVVALDLLTSLLLGLIVALAIYDHKPIMMDVALVLALVSFIGTIGFARYLEIRAWPGTKS